MDFQLNLLLNLVDNMSSGISSAVSGLQNLQSTAENTSNSMNALCDTTMLSNMSSMLNQMGNMAMNLGSGILSGFTKTLSAVQSTGSEFESFRITLNALLGDENKAENALSKLMDFAARTPFEINDLTGMFTTITANGLDAFQMIESGMDGANNKLKDGKQELLAYIGDLMAFRPDVPAMQWATAIRNAFSGQVKSLKNALDVNVTELIGRDWGDTPQQIAQDFKDLADALKVTGLMGGNMNTLNQSMSNLSDQFTRMYLAIGDAGVFRVLSTAITNITRAFSDLEDSDIQSFAQSVSTSFNQLLSPIEKVTRVLGQMIKGFVKFVGQHPKLAQVVMTLTALSGVALIGFGVVLKLASAFSGLANVMLMMNVTGFKVTSALSAGFAKFRTSVLPLIALAGALKFAWSQDLFGIRTNTVNAVNNISNAWSIAKKNVSGSVGDMITAYDQLKNKHDFTSELTVGFMKLMVVMNALSELWNSKDGYTLSDETFQKAKALGVLPLIEAILDLKYRFDEFKKGFIKGWTEIVEKTKKIGKQIADTIYKHLKGTFIGDALDGLKNFLHLLTNNDAKAWNNVGEAIGKVTAVVLPMIAGFKMLQKVISPFKKVGGMLSPIVGGVTKLGKAILPLSTKKKGLIPPLFEESGSSGSSSSGGMLGGSAKDTAKAMGNLAIIIGSVSAIVLAYGALSKMDGFSEFLSTGADTLMYLMKGIIPIITVAGSMALLMKGFTKLKLDYKAVLEGMKSIALSLGGLTLIVDVIGGIQSISNLDIALSTGIDTLNNLKEVVVAVAEICGVIGTAALGFGAFIKLANLDVKSIAEGFGVVATSLIGITAVVDAIGYIQSLPGFNDFLDNGATTLTRVADTLGSMFNSSGVGLVVTFGLIAGLGQLPITTILTGIANLVLALGAITGIIVAFGALSKIDGFNEFITSGGDTLALLFEQIGKVAGALIGGFIGSTVETALPKIGDGLSQFAKKIKPFFDVISSVPLDNVGNFLNALSNITGTLIGNNIASAFGGGADFKKLGEDLTSFGDGIKPFFKSIAEVSDDGIKKAPQVFNALKSIGNSEFKSGGLKGLLGGNTDLGNIGEQLTSFAEGIEPFFKKASTIPEQGLTNAPKVFEALKGIGNSAFKSGWTDFFKGSLDLKSVGEQLTNFANSSNGFFVFAGNLGETAISNTSSLFNALGKLKSVQNLSTLGIGNLPSIGEYLTDFSNNSNGFFQMMSNIGETAITRTTSMFNALSNLKSVQNLSASGIGNLPEIGTDLTDFGNNSNGFFVFASALGETVTSKVNAIVSSVSKMQGMVNVAKGSNGSLSTFATELTNFADGLITFNNKFTSVKNFDEINSLGTVLKQLATVFNSTKTTIESGARSISTSMSDVTSSFSKAVSSLDKSATKMKTTVSTMVTSVKRDISNLVNSFRNTKFNFTQSHIKVPHFSMSGSFDAKTKKVPSVNTKWYQTGGVFDSPSIIGVGENGSEAVMPLEKNLGWIDELASRINDVRSAQPIQSSQVTNMNSQQTSFPTTNTNNNNVVHEGNVDNSVVFSEGSIVINATNCSNEEAERLANIIIQKIKRNQEIKDLTSYRDINKKDLVLM